MFCVTETVATYLTALQATGPQFQSLRSGTVPGSGDYGQDYGPVAERRNSSGGVAGGDYSGAVEYKQGQRGSGDLSSLIGRLNVQTSHSDPSIYSSCQAADAETNIATRGLTQLELEASNYNDDNNSNSSLHCSPSGSDCGRSDSPVGEPSSDTSTSAELSLNYPSPHANLLSSPEGGTDNPFFSDQTYGKDEDGEESGREIVDSVALRGSLRLEPGTCQDPLPQGGWWPRA